MPGGGEVCSEAGWEKNKRRLFRERFGPALGSSGWSKAKLGMLKLATRAGPKKRHSERTATTEPNDKREIKRGEAGREEID